jgi:FkbM family methyltransferase
MLGLLSKFRQYGLKRFIVYSIGEIKQRFYNRYFLHSFSQSNEDLVIDKLLENKPKGFYVDIGAFDPFRFNNTMRFYQKGWKGINIEPNIEKWKRFKQIRPLDINLNVGIGQKKEKRSYYSMDPETLSTFSFKQSEEYKKQGFMVRSVTKVEIVPLSLIFLQHCNNIHIDFLTIDVEGFEMEVLKSNNWKKFRPTFICIEVETPGLNGQIINHPIYTFLKQNKYAWVMNNYTNAIFKDCNETA